MLFASVAVACVPVAGAVGRAGSAVPGIVVCFVFKSYRYTDTHSFMTKTNLAIAASNTHCFIIIIAFLFYPHCSPVLFF